MYSEALRQIAAMRAWFATQRELHLLGSSVLIVYEGDDRIVAALGWTRVRFPCGSRLSTFATTWRARRAWTRTSGAGLDRLSVMLESIVAAS